MPAMHLDVEQVERVRHGELAPEAETRVRAHLAACDSCRQRVAAAEREEHDVLGLLRALDHPAPPLSARDVARRARSSGPPRARLAAGIVLALAAATAAYAAPGSPLPRLMRAATARVSPRAAPSTVAGDARSEPVLSGVAVRPGESLVIVFAQVEREGQALISLATGAEVVVTAPAGAATYEWSADTLSIHNGDRSTTYDIAIPRDAPRVEILVDTRRVFLRELPARHATVPDEALVRYRVPLTVP